MKNSLMEILSKVELDNQQHKEMLEVYHQSRTKWTKENGSCMNAPCYEEHWNKREDYIIQMMKLYIEKNNVPYRRKQ